MTTTHRSKRCFQTQYTDPTTGDTLMQARWYTPTSATFRSRDTWAGDLNTPVTLNRYTYANNNPTRYWDPSGRCVEGLGIANVSGVCTPEVMAETVRVNGTPTSAAPDGQAFDHCIGKSDCRPMVSVDSETTVSPAGSFSTGALGFGDQLQLPGFWQYSQGAGLFQQDDGGFHVDGEALDPQAIAASAWANTFQAGGSKAQADEAYAATLAMAEMAVTTGNVVDDYVPYGSCANMFTAGGSLSRLEKCSVDLGASIVAAGLPGGSIAGTSGHGIPPRPPVTPGRFAQGEIFDVISARAGNVEYMAEVSYSGRTVGMQNLAVFGAEGDLVNQVGAPAFLAVRNALAREAAANGFDYFVVTGVRVQSSSSANPGHVVNYIVKLDKFR